MQNFTPISALIGGGLIGAAAALLLLLNGKIAGVSGILGGLLERGTSDRGERVAFLAGLIGAPVVYVWLNGPPAITVDAALPLLIAAGLLVGFGTRLGNGCTSGHGVCGVSRLSPRSLVATAVFVGVGMLVVAVARHLIGGG